MNTAGREVEKADETSRVNAMNPAESSKTVFNVIFRKANLIVVSLVMFLMIMTNLVSFLLDVSGKILRLVSRLLMTFSIALNYTIE
jgi:hypothetical protein